MIDPIRREVVLIDANGRDEGEFRCIAALNLGFLIQHRCMKCRIMRVHM